MDLPRQAFMTTGDQIKEVRQIVAYAIAQVIVDGRAPRELFANDSFKAEVTGRYMAFKASREDWLDIALDSLPAVAHAFSAVDGEPPSGS